MNYLWVSDKTRYIIAGILACVFFISLGVLLTYRSPYTLSLPLLPHLSAKQQYNLFKQKLEFTDQKYEHAMKRVKSEFAVPDHQWNTMHNQLYMLQKQDALSSRAGDYQDEQPFNQMVAKIARQYGMNPFAIKISCVKDRKIDIQVRQPIINGQILNVLEVNLDWIQKYPLITQEAFIRHEMMHLYNYDPAMQSLLYGLLEDLGHNPELLQHPALVNLNHQIELRADLLACCQSPEIAYAAKYDFDRDSSYLLGKWTSDSHPSPQIRSDQLEKLLHEMQIHSTKQA